MIVVADRSSAISTKQPTTSDQGVAISGNVSTHALDDLLGLDGGPPIPRRPADLVYILYTSGTTGPSKGVCYTNLSAGWLVEAAFEHARAALR